MAGNLAIPTFRTGAKDDLAAVDVYTQRSNAVVNNFRDSLSMPNFGAASSLLGGKSLLSSLPLGQLGNVRGMVSMGTNALLGGGALGNIAKMAGVSNPKVLTAINKLTPTITRAIDKKLASSPQLAKITAQVSGVVGGIGNIQNVISAAQAGNAMGVIGAVNTLTGNTPGIQLTDNRALNSFACGLFSEGVKSGVPGVFSAIQTSIDSSPKFLSGVVKSCLPDIRSTGSISALKEITDIDPKLVTQVSSYTAQDFIKEYPGAPLATTPTEQKQTFTSMMEVLPKVQPDWLTASRSVGGVEETCFNLTPLTGASPAFKETVGFGALGSTEIDTKLMLLSVDNYKPAASPDNLKQMYPAAFSSPTAQSKPVVQDPRVVPEIERLRKAETKERAPLPNVRPLADAQRDLSMLRATMEDEIQDDPALIANAEAEAEADRLGNKALASQLNKEGLAMEAAIRTRYKPRIDALVQEIAHIKSVLAEAEARKMETTVSNGGLWVAGGGGWG